jgi:integrase/recombinase XerD
MMETLYSTGMRRMELANLAMYDLAVERGTVTIRQGKGKKDRVIPIGARALAWIDKYLIEARPELVVPPDEGVLFLNNRGEQLRKDSLTDLIGDYVKSAGIGKEGACHLFRHTMATLMLENGADIRFIQQMLGHSSMEATTVYTQVSIKKLKEIHTETHPAKLKRTGLSGHQEDVSELSTQHSELPSSLPSAEDMLRTLDAEADEELDVS